MALLVYEGEISFAARKAPCGAKNVTFQCFQKFVRYFTKLSKTLYHPYNLFREPEWGETWQGCVCERKSQVTWE